MSPDLTVEPSENPPPQRWMRRVLASVIVLLLVAGLWWFAMPPQLGGRTTLLTTKGVSMAPDIASGDLAVIRAQESYKAGDVIAYYSDNLRANVLHRVIDTHIDGSLITKGDANSWTDVDQPMPDEVTGKMVHLLPGVGSKLDIASSTPLRILLSLVIAYAVYYFVRSFTKQPTEQSPPNRGSPAPRRRVPKPASLSNAWRTASHYGTYVLVSLLVASSATAFVAFSRPLTSDVDSMSIYNLQGTFNYTAPTGEDGELLYPSGQAETGDPLFLNIIDQLNVNYDYNFEGAGEFEGEGAISMNARLTGKSGWTNVIPLSEPEPFTGDTSSASAVIDLNAIDERAGEIREIIGVRESGYTLAVEAVVETSGTFAGGTIDENFASSVSFAVDGAQMRPLEAKSGEDNNPTGGPFQQEQAEEELANETAKPAAGIATSSGGSVEQTSGMPAELQAFGASVGVLSLRVASAIGIAVSLVGLVLQYGGGAVLGSRSARAPKDPESLAKLFIPTTGWATPVTGVDLYDVNSINDLVHIARRNDRLILHETRHDCEVFILNLDEITYRYVHYSDDANERFGAERGTAADDKDETHHDDPPETEATDEEVNLGSETSGPESGDDK